FNALKNNNTGTPNTAVGSQALVSNDNGGSNTAVGFQALFSNVGGDQNTAVGRQALQGNISGNQNTAVGLNALAFSKGSSNIALGSGAGFFVQSATSNNTICIGSSGQDVSDACFIGNIAGANEGGTISAVYINTNGQLGTQP